jgi:hypothetical protein
VALFRQLCQNCVEYASVGEEHHCLKPSNSKQTTFVVCAAESLCHITFLVPINGGHNCQKCHKPVHSMCGLTIEDSFQVEMCFKCESISKKALRGSKPNASSPSSRSKPKASSSSSWSKPKESSSSSWSKPKESSSSSWSKPKPSAGTKIRSRNELTVDTSSGALLFGDTALDEVLGDQIFTYYGEKLPRDDNLPVVRGGAGKGQKKKKVVSKAYDYVHQKVAFSHADGKFMNLKAFEDVGGAYIVGEVCETKHEKGVNLYRIQWGGTQFQRVKTWITLDALTVGIIHYNKYKNNQSSLDSSWNQLCNTGREVIDGFEMEGDISCMNGADPEDEVMLLYEESKPSTLQQVEDMRNINWNINTRTTVPVDIYTHFDETLHPDPEISYVKKKYEDQFLHSPASAFLSYLSIGFWKQITFQSNLHAKSMLVGNCIHGHKFLEITLEEMMKFLGLMIFMKVVSKGEAKNYWGSAEEDYVFRAIDPTARSTTFDMVMSFVRYKQIKSSFCFRYLPPEKITEAKKTDTLWRLRPLISFIRKTCGEFIVPGRNVSIDEGTEASKSRFAGSFICYNPAKPTGKHHFKYYIVTAADSYIMLNIRIHGDNTQLSIEDDFVEDEGGEEESKASLQKLRAICLDLMQPLFGTKRIVNMDNYYTSPQLLHSFDVKGLYARGTLRMNRKHVPISMKFSRQELRDLERGSMKIMGAPNNLSMLSWIDNGTVYLLSNCDSSSDLIQVTRRKSLTPEAITLQGLQVCREYSKNMQGVDRLDQNRCRFSVAKGHSAKKWYVKMGLSLIDLAKSNAYLTRRLVLKTRKVPDPAGDPHLTFMLELVRQLITEEWKQVPLNDVLFYDLVPSPTTSTSIADFMSPEKGRTIKPTARHPVLSPTVVINCKPVHPKYYSTAIRAGECAVCRFELRGRKQAGNFCMTHCVALCLTIRPAPESYDFVCPDQTLSCWDKFHNYYQQLEIFSSKGNLNKAHEVVKKQVAQLKSMTNSAPEL